MLTIKNYASKLGAVALLLGVTFAACKDDDAPASPILRSKEFKLIKAISLTDSAQIGTVKLSENLDSSVNLSLTLSKTTKDTAHKVYVIYGVAATPLTDTIFKGSLTGTGASASVDIWKNLKTVTVNGQTRNFRYDSALAISAFTKVRFSTTKDSVIAIGNILKSAK
jgi:hypothetical protein